MGCTCSTAVHQVYIGCLVFHFQTINGTSFGLGLVVAIALFLLSEFCCPDLLSALARNCCSLVRKRRTDQAPTMCPVYLPSAPSAGTTLGQTLNTGTMCLAPQPEGGGVGGMMFGNSGDYSFNGHRPTVYFSPKMQSDWLVPDDTNGGMEVDVKPNTYQ